MKSAEKRKVYVVKRNTEKFREGDLVESSIYQRYKTKTSVTNNEVIGKWPCCGCNMIKWEFISNKNLQYLSEL